MNENAFLVKIGENNNKLMNLERYIFCYFPPSAI